jgi:hypothetical protein
MGRRGAKSHVKLGGLGPLKSCGHFISGMVVVIGVERFWVAVI